jgi:hypothetical protein
VVKSKADYSLARWQVDAHAFWRSSGNRLLTADEMAALGPAKLAKFFTDDSLRASTTTSGTWPSASSCRRAARCRPRS